MTVPWMWRYFGYCCSKKRMGHDWLSTWMQLSVPRLTNQTAIRPYITISRKPTMIEVIPTLVLWMCWCWYSESNSGSLKYDWSWSHMGGATTPTPAPGSTPPFMSVDSNSLRTERSRMSRRCDLQADLFPNQISTFGNMKTKV